jgi:hypothetical protein
MFIRQWLDRDSATCVHGVVLKAAQDVIGVWVAVGKPHVWSPLSLIGMNKKWSGSTHEFPRGGSRRRRSALVSLGWRLRGGWSCWAHFLRCGRKRWSKTRRRETWFGLFSWVCACLTYRSLGFYKISINEDTIAIITSMDNTITAYDCSSSNCHIGNTTKVSM